MKKIILSLLLLSIIPFLIFSEESVSTDTTSAEEIAFDPDAINESKFGYDIESMTSKEISTELNKLIDPPFKSPFRAIKKNKEKISFLASHLDQYDKNKIYNANRMQTSFLSNTGAWIGFGLGSLFQKDFVPAIVFGALDLAWLGATCTGIASKKESIGEMFVMLLITPLTVGLDLTIGLFILPFLKEPNLFFITQGLFQNTDIDSSIFGVLLIAGGVKIISSVTQIIFSNCRANSFNKKLNNSLKGSYVKKVAFDPIVNPITKDIGFNVCLNF